MPKLRREKGLSQVITTTLLILIAITVSILVSAWLSSLTKTETGGIQNRTQVRLSCERGYLTITSVYYNCSNDCSADINHTITLNIRNTGEIKLSLDKIYVINKTGTTYTLIPNVTSLDISEIKTIGNVSRDSCGGFNKTIDEIMITTGCSNVYDTFPGVDIVYQNC